MKYEIKVQTIPGWGTEVSINGPLPNFPSASCQLAAYVPYKGETKESYSQKLAARCREYAAIYTAAAEFLYPPNATDNRSAQKPSDEKETI
jgi:hypothetical protein